MGSSDNPGKFGDMGVIELTGKVVAVAIVFFLFIVFFVFCFHLYAKCFWYRRQENPTTTATTTRRRRRLDFAAGYHEIAIASALRRGLDPSALKNIPVVVFDPKEFKDGLECAVCLCEVSEGEKARLLPKCNHGFHVDCIDMWFESHSTCPLCRNPVDNLNQLNSGSESAMETVIQSPTGENSGANVVSADAPNFPTNVLIWGNETQVRTFGPGLEESHQANAVAEPSSSSSMLIGSSISRPDSGSVIIDVTRQINEEEEEKVPVPTRLRSLKRLLSGNRRAGRSSPRNLDLEQGSRG